jgi:hypothetical protein
MASGKYVNEIRGKPQALSVDCRSHLLLHNAGMGISIHIRTHTQRLSVIG